MTAAVGATAKASEAGRDLGVEIPDPGELSAEVHQAEAAMDETLPGAPAPRWSWLRLWDQALDAAAAALLLFMVVVACIQVVSRYVLGSPLPWPEELARWSFLWLVMLGCVMATRVGGHIRMAMLVHRLPASTRRHTDLLGIGLSACGLAFLGRRGIGLMTSTTVDSVNLGISYRWLYLAIPVGALLSLLALARSRVPGVPRWAVPAAVTAGIVFAELGPALVQRSILIVLDTTTVALVACLVLLLLGAPVAHALLLGAAVAFEAGGLPDQIVANHFSSEISTNFVMLAIPFFVLMGALMNAGGITAVLIRLAMSLVGHWRGGMGQVNIATSTLLGGLSGSSSADTAMVAKTLIKPMEKTGYSREFASAITASAAIIATLLPPSISFLLYASLAGVSVGALFMAGVIPGLLYAAALMGMVWWASSRKRGTITASPRVPRTKLLHAATKALPAMLLPIGILALLRVGAVTATEAGAAACLFAALIGTLLYRELSPAGIWRAALEGARDTAVILFLLAASAPLAWLLIAEQIPARLGAQLAHIQSTALLMTGIVVFLLVIGLILEPPPAMVLVVPVLAPIAAAAGIDLVHLGVVLVLTIMIGQLTPPVGGLVFIAAAISKAKVSKVFWETRSLYIPMGLVLLLLVLLPALSLWLPAALGYR